MQVRANTVFETRLHSVFSYSNPLREMPVPVVFTAPSGGHHRGQAFWNGGQDWRIRFRPTEPGDWSWRTEIFNSADTGLLMKAGTFTCVPYDGDQALPRHGRLRVADSGAHLAHADGTPFLWLADTAWNGLLRSTAADWEEYLAARAAQGFTVVQCVGAQWRGHTAGVDGQPLYETGPGGLRVCPEAFSRLDERLQAANAHGLAPAVVMLWALGEDDPGRALAEADAIQLCRYMRARWDALEVVYLLGGDGQYESHPPGRWERIGRAVFPDRDRPPVTLHPCGLNWVDVERYHDEPWLDFHGYQSGHGDSEAELRWHLAGPPRRPWELTPPKPLLNLEPMYEAHPSYRDGHPFDAREVRRALYWSVLTAPVAGVTYGHCWVWPWSSQREAPENHEGCGAMGPWREGLGAAGAQGVGMMRRLLECLPWWQLGPAQELLAVQPGDADPTRAVVAAATADRRVIVIYNPTPGPIALQDGVGTGGSAEWFDPVTGATGKADRVGNAFAPPGGRDWVLVLTS